MTILGIDPGLKNTGWGVIHVVGSRKVLKYIDHGVILSSEQDSLALRILTIYQKIENLVNIYKPNLLSNEALVFQKNVTSALPVAHARGVIFLLSAQHKIEIKSFAPNTIKQAVTGSGSAKKLDVQRMVKILLNLNTIPHPDHASDALACAITAAYGNVPISNKLT